QQFSDLNIQLAQTMAEESTRAGQGIITADRQTELFSIGAAHAHPIAEKMRAYQEHLSRIAVDSQVDLAKVTEDHVQETSRTAQTLAQEVKRVADDEMEKNKRTQQDAIKNFTD